MHEVCIGQIATPAALVLQHVDQIGGVTSSGQIAAAQQTGQQQQGQCERHAVTAQIALLLYRPRFLLSTAVQPVQGLDPLLF